MTSANSYEHSIELDPKVFKDLITASSATTKGAAPGSIWQSTLLVVSGDWICFLSSNGTSRVCSAVGAGKGTHPNDQIGKVVTILPVFHVWNHIVEDNEPIVINFSQGFTEISQYRWAHVYRNLTEKYPIEPHALKMNTDPTVAVSQEQLARHLYTQQSFPEPEKVVVRFHLDPMKKQIVTDLPNGYTLSVLEYYGAPNPVNFALNLIDLPILNAIPEEKLYLGLCDPEGRRIMVFNEQKTFKFLLKGVV